MIHDLIRFIEGIWHNTALVAAFSAILITQVLKVPIHFLQYRVWDFHKVIDAGGMPSSHAAGAGALVTALAYVVGPQSPVFATAVVFAAVVMYDAGGIRRHAGEHAALLNRIALELQKSGLTPRPPRTQTSRGSG
ncbi:hypothetical protein GCM10025857_07870 [Alicyclobacillus contaminans]|nr:hypothetical protein GCM10025857_07870 [Alicyclobacillus contaminans]